jgi:hypothetical protein
MLFLTLRDEFRKFGNSGKSQDTLCNFGKFGNSSEKTCFYRMLCAVPSRISGEIGTFSDIFLSKFTKIKKCKKTKKCKKKSVENTQILGVLSKIGLWRLKTLKKCRK